MTKATLFSQITSKFNFNIQAKTYQTNMSEKGYNASILIKSILFRQIIQLLKKSLYQHRFKWVLVCV
jgi:hypothetical protein